MKTCIAPEVAPPNVATDATAASPTTVYLGVEIACYNWSSAAINSLKDSAAQHVHALVKLRTRVACMRHIYTNYSVLSTMHGDVDIENAI